MDPFHVGFVCLFVVIAAVYDAYSVPLSAVHILWSLPLTVMVGSGSQWQQGLYGQVPN